MRLKEYGRNANKRKEYVHQPDLLLVGVDVSKAKHSACLGTQTGISCRKLAFTHPREGFQLLEQTLRDHLGKTHCRRTLIAMEPSGIYWQALYERLKSCGYGVCTARDTSWKRGSPAVVVVSGALRSFSSSTTSRSRVLASPIRTVSMSLKSQPWPTT